MFNYEKLRKDFEKHMILHGLTRLGLIRKLSVKNEEINDFLNETSNFPIHKISRSCEILGLDIETYLED